VSSGGGGCRERETLAFMPSRKFGRIVKKIFKAPEFLTNILM